MKQSRRNFLSRAGLLTGGALLPTFGFTYKLFAQAIARSEADHFFLMIRTYGAMDATLGLDPQVHRVGSDQNDIFIEYRPEDIFSVQGLKFGPAASPLKPFAGDIAVVNGILMATENNDHTALNAYMRSGDPKGKLGSFPVELAAHSSVGPLGVVVFEATEMGQCDVVISSTNEISVSNAYSDANVSEPYLVSASKNKESFIRVENAYQKSKQYEPSIAKVVSDLSKKYDSNVYRPAIAAAAAFSSGGSKQGEISIAAAQSSLDTHNDHEGNHLKTQLEYWNQVANIFTMFKNVPYKEGTLFDHTTFMVMTEFSRTPFLNSNKGKDHNPLTNSILLAGKSINGGNTFGQSHSYSRKETEDGVALHMGLPLNFANGKPAKSENEATFLRPEHIFRTLVTAYENQEAMSVDHNLPLVKGLIKNT